MAESARQPQETAESCGDECVIDLSKFRSRPKEEAEPEGRASLIMLTRGTYGHHDDGFSAIQVGNALLAEEQGATLLLLGDGVYFAVKGQKTSNIELPNYLRYIEDFCDLGGRILALNTSLAKRGLAQEDLVDGIEVITTSQMVREIEGHDVSVTF